MRLVLHSFFEQRRKQNTGTGKDDNEGCNASGKTCTLNILGQRYRWYQSKCFVEILALMKYHDTPDGPEKERLGREWLQAQKTRRCPVSCSLSSKNLVPQLPIHVVIPARDGYFPWKCDANCIEELRVDLSKWYEDAIEEMTSNREIPNVFEYELLFIMSYAYGRLLAGMSINKGFRSFGSINVAINEGRAPDIVGTEAFMMFDFAQQMALIAIWMISFPNRPVPMAINRGWRQETSVEGSLAFAVCQQQQIPVCNQVS